MKLSMGATVTLTIVQVRVAPSLHRQWGKARACECELQMAGRCFFGTSDTMQNFHPHLQRASAKQCSFVALWEAVVPFRPNGSASRRGFTSSHSDLLLLCAGCQGRKRFSCSGWKDNTAGQ